MKQGQMVTGTIEGTGTALNVQLGFKPSVVTLINQDGLCRLDWCESMGDGKGLKAVTAGTISFIATDGVTPYDGTTAGDSAGFTIGADADVNAVAETIHYIAQAAE